MNRQSKSYLFAFLTVLFWATVATAFKIALRDLNNIQLLFIANLTSLVIFGFFIVASGKLSELKHENLKGISLSALQGLLNPFAYYLVLFLAYSILPAQVAQPANFIWPLVLMLLSVPLLHQPLRFTGVIGLVISFSGVYILASQGHPADFKIAQPKGLILALSTSLIWAFYWIINLKDKRDDLIKLFLGFAFSMVYITILAAFTGNLTGILSKPWLPSVYIGLFEMGISFIFWLKALQYSESTGKVANLIYLTPFFSLLVIHTVLHEKLLVTSILGLCLIISGILVSQIKKK